MALNKPPRPPMSFARKLAVAAAVVIGLQVGYAVSAAAASGPAQAESQTTRVLPADCAKDHAYILAGPRFTSEGTSVQQVDLNTGARTEIGEFTVGPRVAVNGLGMQPGGHVAWGVSEQEDATGVQTVFRLNLDDNITTSFPGAPKTSDGRPRETVRGAMNPLNGWYYYSHSVENPADQNRPTTQVVYAFDTVHEVNVGVVGTLTDPRFNGSSGDMVFDSAGTPYMVVSTPENLAPGGLDSSLIRINDDLNTPGNKSVTAQLVADLPNGAAYGVTFGADGYLYTTRARVTPDGELFKINPNSGELVSTITMTAPQGEPPTPIDAGNCSYGPNISAQTDIPGRYGPGDQFTVTITGNGTVSGNTGTSAGTDTGVQDTPPEVAGPLPGTVGKSYTFTQSPANGADLANYDTTYQCVDTAHANQLLTRGSGNTFDLTVPVSPDSRGVAVLCTFTNTPKPPPNPAHIVVAKSADPVTTSTGRTVHYTLTITNTGDTPATGVRAEDDLSDVIDNASYNNDVAAPTGSVTYTSSNSKVIWTGDLAPGEKTTITYSVTVEAEDYLVNSVTVTAPNSNCPGDAQCSTSTTTPLVEPGAG
ncbi:hypothetical protein [Streptomyces sp. NPDC086787]|uniref:DUF7927 domain-containing protein n=1 Tax=Streptomyces sp. NPDC086787 TaxID=3365759 RepID=UPI0037F9844D